MKITIMLKLQLSCLVLFLDFHLLMIAVLVSTTVANSYHVHANCKFYIRCEKVGQAKNLEQKSQITSTIVH